MKKSFITFSGILLLLFSQACSSLSLDHIDSPLAPESKEKFSESFEMTYANHPVGQIPFDFPANVQVKSKPTDLIFAPSKENLVKLYEDNTTPIKFEIQQLVKPDEKESIVKNKDEGEYRVPNPFIIAIPSDETVVAGDVVLTRGPGKTGLGRAIIVEGGTRTEPKAKYLDYDTDKQIATLGENTFTKLTGGVMRGTPTVIKFNDEYVFEVLICDCGGKVLSMGWDGSLRVHDQEYSNLIKIYEDYKDGDDVFVPISGKYRPGVVTKVNKEFGELTIRYEDNGLQKEDNFSIIEVSKTLD